MVKRIDHNKVVLKGRLWYNCYENIKSSQYGYRKVVGLSIRRKSNRLGKMKKKKLFGLYGTNKRDRAKKAYKYTNEEQYEYDRDFVEKYDDSYEDYDADDEQSDYETVYYSADGYNNTSEDYEEYYDEESDELYYEGDGTEDIDSDELYYDEYESDDEESEEEYADYYESDEMDLEESNELYYEEYESDEKESDELYYEEYESDEEESYELYYEEYKSDEEESYELYYEEYESDEGEADELYYDEYESDDEESDETYYDEEFEIAYGNVNEARIEDGSSFGYNMAKKLEQFPMWLRIKEYISSMTAFDTIIAVTGIVVVVAAIVTFSMFVENKHMNEQVEAIAPIGNELTEMGIPGEEGIMAIVNAASSGMYNEQLQTESVPVEPEPDVEVSKVSVSFESIEKDLKIRFIDSATGEYIKGTAFEVVLTNSKGKKLVLKDDDKDGIIYATNVNPGVFEAIITSTDKYKFPTMAQKVTVKDKVEYVVINVTDEVKKENEVNVSVEDTQKQDAAKDEQKLVDTVEWVESTKTLIEGSQGYLLIDKNTISDPSQLSKLSARMLFDGFNVTIDNNSATLNVGESVTLKGSMHKDAVEGEKEYKYTVEWSSSNNDVATVSDGVVSAKAKGTATITYKVTKKTITTTYEPEKPIEETFEISIEDYEALSEEEKKKCTPINGEDGNIVAYAYTKVTEPQKIVDEVSETASATCEIVVEDAQITEGTLEISASSNSCKVGEKVSVKPSKIVYKKQDGSTETITDSFPKIEWTSSDKNIATVESDGVVTAIKAGKVTITGQVNGIEGADGTNLSIKASVDITIDSEAKFAIVLDKTKDVIVPIGKTVTLVATVTNYKSDGTVTWSSSDKNVATVDDKGVITGVAVGSATITATTNEKDNDGNQLKASCVVTVTSSATSDTTTKLKDKNGNQIYVKSTDGKYKEAVYADYFAATEFYIATEGRYAYTGWQTINGKTYFYDKTGTPVTGKQVIQGVVYNFGTDGAIATKVNGSTFGIDVSRHNGNIDWNAVKASGVDYVIIRCGYRGSVSGALIEDESFRKNIKGATAAGLKVGVYVFSQAVNEVEAVKEASLAVSLVKGYNLTYPIFIDTESSGGRADKIDVATRTAVVNAFCQTVANAGYQPGIYASKSWYETKLNMGAIGNYRIWLAQYSAAPTYGGKYDMWQYSSKGKINGIKGNVDLNWSYMGY